MKKRIVSSIVAALLVSGCSTVLDGPTQDLTIETPGTVGALCFVETPGFQTRVWAPQTVRIMKTKDPLQVKCRAPGNREKTIVIEPGVSGTAFLNVTNGVVPGALVDRDTGAMFSYPEKVVVDFTDMVPQDMPKPDYQYTLDQNPTIAGMESFRPGQAALDSDRTDVVKPLQGRRSEVDMYGGGDEAVITDISSSDDGADVMGAAASAATAAVKAEASTADALTRQMNPSVFAK